MITDKQKSNIIFIIDNMKHLDILYFKDFTPEEREYIMQLILTQKGTKGFNIETNGVSADKKKITKFRKLCHSFNTRIEELTSK